MTLVSTPVGLIFPWSYQFPNGTNAGTMDATGEKYAMLGRLYIDGRPTSSKTISASGPGNIQCMTGTVLWATGTTTMDIGLQGVATGTGLIAQPDGVFGAKASRVGGDGAFTSNAWKTINITTGTSTLTHGDLIAVVWDMTNRAGTDSVIISCSTGISTVAMGAGAYPNVNAFVSSAWQTTQAIGAARAPRVLITFDDGTLGWIDGGQVFSGGPTAETYSDTVSPPDERGLMFQVPWNVKIDALWALAGATDAASDFTVKLYSSPTSSPSLITSQTVLAENMGIPANTGWLVIPLSTEQSLTRNTNYAVTVLATGTTNVRLTGITLGNTAHRVTIPGGTTLAKVTRDGSSGNFTAESPAVTMYCMGVRISQFDDGTGSGAGGGGNSVFGGLGGVIV